MKARILAVPLAAALLAVSGCSIARNALYAPRTEPIAIAEWTKAQPERLSVSTRDGLILEGFYWPPARADDRDIFIFFHGRGAHQGVGAKYAQYLAAGGDAILVASYRGFGGKPGHPSREGLLTDATAFVAKARQLAGPDARLWFVGHSLGAAVALQAACTDGHAAGVIAISAFSDIREAAPPLLRSFLPDQWDNRRTAHCVTAPLLILQGAEDRIVAPSSAAVLLKSSGGPATAIAIANWAHKPVMQTMGPWVAEAIEALAKGEGTPLPPLPEHWAIEGVHRP